MLYRVFRGRCCNGWTLLEVDGGSTHCPLIGACCGGHIRLGGEDFGSGGRLSGVNVDAGLVITGSA